MKRILSILLTLVLLVSSLVIPMTISAEGGFDGTAHIAAIKNAVDGLKMKEENLVQIAFPSGSYAIEDPNTEDNEVTLYDAKVLEKLDIAEPLLGDKAVQLPVNKDGVTAYASKQFWSFTANEDYILNFNNLASTTTGGQIRAWSIGDVRQLHVYVKSNIDFKYNYAFYSTSTTQQGKGTTDFTATSDDYQKLTIDLNNLGLNWSATGNPADAPITRVYISFMDADTATKGLPETAEIIVGSVWAEWNTEEIIAFNKVAFEETTKNNFLAILKAAENIDASFYTDATAQALANAIADAKKDFVTNATDAQVAELITNELGSLFKEVEILLPTSGYKNATSTVGTLDTCQGGLTSILGVPQFVTADMGANTRYFNSKQTLLQYTQSTVSGVSFALADYEDIYLKVYADYDDGRNLSTDGATVSDLFGQAFITFVNSSNASTNTGNSEGGAAMFASFKNVFVGVNKITKLSLKSILESSNAVTLKSAQFKSKNGNAATPLSPTEELAMSPIIGLKRYGNVDLGTDPTKQSLFLTLSSLETEGWENASDIEQTNALLSDVLIATGNYPKPASNAIIEAVNGLEMKPIQYAMPYGIYGRKGTSTLIYEKGNTVENTADEAYGTHTLTIGATDISYYTTNFPNITGALNNFWTSSERDYFLSFSADLSKTTPESTYDTSILSSKAKQISFYVSTNAEIKIQPTIQNRPGTAVTVSANTSKLLTFDITQFNNGTLTDTNAKYLMLAINVVSDTVPDDLSITIGSMFYLPEENTVAKEFNTNYGNVDTVNYAMLDDAENINKALFEDTSELETAISEAKAEYIKAASMTEIGDWLANRLSGAETEEIVWVPKWSYERNTTVLQAGAGTDEGLTAEQLNKLGDFHTVVKKNDAEWVVVWTDEASPNNVNSDYAFERTDYEQYKLLIINNADETQDIAIQFKVYGPQSSQSADFSSDKTLEPGDNYYDIPEANIGALTNNATKFRILQMIMTPSKGDLVVGSVIGVNALDTTALKAAAKASDIRIFMEDEVLNKKGVKNSEAAIALYEELEKSGKLALDDAGKEDMLRYYWSLVTPAAETLMIPVNGAPLKEDSVSTGNYSLPVKDTPAEEVSVWGDKFADDFKADVAEDGTLSNRENTVFYYEPDNTAFDGTKNISFKFADFTELYVPYYLTATSTNTLSLAQWSDNEHVARYNNLSLHAGEGKYDLLAQIKYNYGDDYAAAELIDGDYNPGAFALRVHDDLLKNSIGLKLGSVVGVKKLDVSIPQIFNDDGSVKDTATLEELVFATALIDGENASKFTGTEKVIEYATQENFPDLKVEGFGFSSTYVKTKDGSAIHGKDGAELQAGDTEYTSIRLAAAYKSPRKETFGHHVDATKIVLDGGVTVPLKSRSIFLATEKTVFGENGLGDAFGTANGQSKVSYSLATGDKLASYWDGEYEAGNLETGKTIFALPYKNIKYVNKDTNLVLRAKIEFEIGDRLFVFYTDNTSTFKSAVGDVAAGSKITVENLYKRTNHVYTNGTTNSDLKWFTEQVAN